MFSAIAVSAIPEGSLSAESGIHLLSEWLYRGSTYSIWISDETFGNDEILSTFLNHNPIINAIALQLRGTNKHFLTMERKENKSALILDLLIILSLSLFSLFLFHKRCLFSFISACFFIVRHMKRLNQLMVWDPLLRIFHWLLVVCFLIAYIFEDKMFNLHLLVGSIIFGLLIFRLIWGVIGTKYARFSGFICSIKALIQHLRGLVRLDASPHIGHTPAGGIMIIFLLAGLLMLTASGLMLYGLENSALFGTSFMAEVEIDTILLIEKMHGWGADTLALAAVLHVAGVLLESILQKQNLICAMITGYKTVEKEDI